MASVAVACAAIGGIGVTAASLQPARAAVSLEADLNARLARARGGEVIRLAAGEYGLIRFPARRFSPALRLEAAGARFTKLQMRDTAGVIIRGGTVVGPGARSYAIQMTNVRDVRIEGMTITGAHRGIVLGASSNVQLINNQLVGLLSDGIDIALSRLIEVRGNRCANFLPTPSTFDAAGRRLSHGDHPDCIQAWSNPRAAPTADLVIEDNLIEGRMQGIFLGNHVRNGIDDGGFDRVVIRNNRVRVSYANAVAVYNGRDSVVTGNIVSTVPGSFNVLRPTSPIRANLRVSGERNRVCGNRVDSFPNHPAARRC